MGDEVKQTTEAPKKNAWTPERKAAHAAGIAKRKKANAPVEKVRAARRVAAVEVHKAAPNRFQVRLAQLEAEKAALEVLAALPEDVAARVCAIAAAA